MSQMLKLELLILLSPNIQVDYNYESYSLLHVLNKNQPKQKI